MKRNFLTRFCFILFFVLSFSLLNPIKVSAQSAEYYLGGYPAGFSIYEKGVRVIGLCDVVTSDGVKSPSKDAGVDVGDLILQIDGKEVNSSSDVMHIINGQELVSLRIKRIDKEFSLLVKPAKDMSNVYKLGLFIKDCVTGIGTITYITDNKIGCLGHPVLDENGSILQLSSGIISKCSISSCIKSVKGRPGELRGVIEKSEICGKIINNYNSGVFAVKENNCYKSKKISLGNAKPGEAFIYTTVFGDKPSCYSINIIKAINDDESKDMVIKITDEKLLEITGGIVQGMSGSPIVQDGQLVGAVTHVFINDPTMGFGINISKMIFN